VNGPNVLDSSGNVHIFRGLDRPSLESNNAGDSLSQGDYQVMQMWGANVVRVSLNQDFWLSDSPMYDPSYQGTVDQQVQWAEGFNLDVILDLHWSDKGDYTNAPGGQQQMPDQHSNTFWQQVANKYKGDPHVLFELYNEPILYPGGSLDPWGVWLNGGDCSAASGGPTGFSGAVGMQTLYNTIRATGAQNLVIIGGIHYAYDLSGVPSHAIQNGSNIMYATHPYAQSDKQPGTWNTAFGSLSATAPVIATEFGNQQSGAPNGPCDTTYLSEFIQYAGKQNPGGTSGPSNKLSWTAWAFYVTTDQCHYPTLLADYYDPNSNGTVVMNALMAGP
jgi:hypothetical protein